MTFFWSSHCAFLVQEIKSFRNAFEQLLASLANHDNEEANTLMVSALETVEMMNNALQLKDEVKNACSSLCLNVRMDVVRWGSCLQMDARIERDAESGAV